MYQPYSILLWQMDCFFQYRNDSSASTAGLPCNLRSRDAGDQKGSASYNDVQWWHMMTMVTSWSFFSFHRRGWSCPNEHRGSWEHPLGTSPGMSKSLLLKMASYSYGSMFVFRNRCFRVYVFFFPEYLSKMEIFHSYVSLPECNMAWNHSKNAWEVSHIAQFGDHGKPNQPRLWWTLMNILAAHWSFIPRGPTKRHIL